MIVESVTIAKWYLGTAVTPDVHARVVSAIRTKSTWRKIYSAVHADTGLKKLRRYKKWLRSDATLNDLVHRDRDARARLLESLIDAERLEKGLGDDAARSARAIALLESTITHYLPALDAAFAAAVVDHRSEQRHVETLDAIHGRSEFVEHLTKLPPLAAELLCETGGALAEQIADTIVRNDPRQVLRQWHTVPPAFLDGAPAVIVFAVGNLAMAYGLTKESIDFIERAAELGYNAPQSYFTAAFQAAHIEDTERAAILIEKARSLGVGVAADMFDAFAARDWAAVVALVTIDEAAQRESLSQMYCFALQALDRLPDAIRLAERCVVNHPNRGWPALVLARLLMQRATVDRGSSRQRDIEECINLALSVRDGRRRWRGDSAEPLRIACDAALESADYQTVLRLGSPDPLGDASADEAADPNVRYCVLEAALATGDRDRAQRVAQAASPGFWHALMHAEVTSASDPGADVSEAFQAAWDLAEDDGQKAAVWLGAAGAGIDPVPGADELVQRPDDLAQAVEALQLVASGQSEKAITALRLRREDERSQALLVTALLRNEQHDEAVELLLDISDRFRNPDYGIRAVEILGGRRMLAEAAGHAERLLPLVRHGRNKRDVLHEVLVAAAESQRKWTTMEARAIAWIEDRGVSGYRRWFVVQAIYNQGETKRAWDFLQRDGDCEIRYPVQAALWIALHQQFDPSTATLDRAMQLVAQFPGDSLVRRTAVNAYMLRDDVVANDIEDWSRLIDERAADDSPDDYFEKLTVSDDADELIEMLRAQLEPQALRVREMLSHVRRHGWPTGVLAMVAGRTYTRVLALRGAGLVPLASANPDIVEAERAAARVALQQGRAIIDLSAVVVGWFIDDAWPIFLAKLPHVTITSDSKLDAFHSMDTSAPRANTRLSWNVSTQTPAIQEISEDELDNYDEHVEWVTSQIGLLNLIDVPNAPEDEKAPAPWLTTIQVAQAFGYVFWADDAGLRQIARDEGVAAFGTDSLLAVLEEQEVLRPLQFSSSIRRLREADCVDLPLDPHWLLDSASHQHWRPGPAMRALGRSAAWADPDAHKVWKTIILSVAARDRAQLGYWVFVAGTAVAGFNLDFETKINLAVGLVADVQAATSSDPEAFACSVGAIADAWSEYGLHDPTSALLAAIFEHLSQQAGPARAAMTLARLGDQLAAEQHKALRRILFRLP
ncbi:MAG: hypothetical protein HZB15_10500 [Actinobacteria bacterium]|nr:hypothetical protein [Actinomycetota bacterium]